MFFGLIKRRSVRRRPEFRLVPDDRDTYTLQRWTPPVGYLAQTCGVKDEAEAKIIIKRLRRQEIYID